MKRILTCVLGLAAVLAADVTAQSGDAATIERALAPISGRTAEGAAVVAFNADHTWRTLKAGTNRWACYDRSGEAGQPAFSVQCTSVGNLPRIAQNRKLAAENQDRDALRAAVAAAEADGTRVDAEYGSMWIRMAGENRQTAGTHTTIAVPGATTATTGLPDNGTQGGAYIMSAGTSEAHIMVPGR